MTYQRLVTARIDDILAIMRDYCGSDDIPHDARPLNLQYNPSEKGKLSIIIDSPSLTDNSPLEIKFDLRKHFAL